MQPSMPQMPSDAPVSPPLMPFAGHPETPLTSQENPVFPMQGMPLFDPASMVPFDFNPMWPMGLMHPSMHPMYWPATPSTSAGIPMATPSTGDSGVSSLEGTPSEESEVFRRVQGRLSLVNNIRQYDVTCDELRRRLNGPESMNSSVIAAYLRKPKTKDGGPQLRKEMQQSGVEIPNNRKKSMEHTCYSALLEEEAVLMANQMTGIAHNYFPTAAMAQQLASMAAMSPERLQQLHRDAFHAARFLKEVLHLSNQVNVPICGRRVTPVNDPVHQGMYLFSAVTHGFGIINHKTWLATFSEMASQVAQQTSGAHST